MPNAPARVLAIDFGKARAGIAVSDELGMYAHARPALDAKNRKALLAALTGIIRDEGITRILIGLPLELSGDRGPAARRALQFAQEIADASGLEVELIDERLSTVEAGRQLRASGVDSRKQRALVDGVAASVLLQSWLDGRRPDTEG
ncbi:MAG TPA: Holliday junction resolvase RuvX [Polyangiaceae bacterium]|nr:Holliday junction resolvase RuvX [Polyangiaceae bacterium]